MDDGTIELIWQKARYINTECEKAGFRQDSCNAWIRRSEHGNRQSRWGWEVHHIIPKNHNGSDNITNLAPLHWRNNTATSDGPIVCSITASGNQNIYI